MTSHSFSHDRPSSVVWTEGTPNCWFAFAIHVWGMMWTAFICKFQVVRLLYLTSHSIPVFHKNHQAHTTYVIREHYKRVDPLHLNCFYLLNLDSDNIIYKLVWHKVYMLN